MKHLLLCWMLAGYSFAGAQNGWTGEVIFDVTPAKWTKTSGITFRIQ